MGRIGHWHPWSLLPMQVPLSAGGPIYVLWHVRPLVCYRKWGGLVTMETLSRPCIARPWRGTASPMHHVRSLQCGAAWCNHADRRHLQMPFLSVPHPSGDVTRGWHQVPPHSEGYYSMALNLFFSSLPFKWFGLSEGWWSGWYVHISRCIHSLTPACSMPQIL